MGIWFLVFFLSMAEEAPKCPSSQTPSSNLMPEMLKNYAQRNKVKSPAEMICCLAKLPNMAIVISPTSIAAQNGDSKNPRILLVQTDKLHGASKINAMFSINSGAAHLNQKDSVEMMFSDPSNGKLVYSDIDFAQGKAHFSKRNPETCMLCHGDGGKVPHTGPRPIFDAPPWSKFLATFDLSEGSLTARSKRGGKPLCPQRDKLERPMEKSATEARESMPAYSCLKDLPRHRLNTIDRLLVKENQKTVTRSIVTSKDYSKFKYAIVGSLALNCTTFLPEHYIPKHVLDTMTKQDGLPSTLQQAKDKTALVEATYDIMVKEHQNALQRDQLKQDHVSKAMSGEAVSTGDEFYEQLQCGAKPDSRYASMKINLNSTFPSTNMVFNRYLADEDARLNLNGSQRFMFESRGINIGHWGMQATDSYNRKLDFNVKDLLQWESPNSPLRRALSGKHIDCEMLKRESMKALGGNTETTEEAPQETGNAESTAESE